MSVLNAYADFVDSTVGYPHFVETERGYPVEPVLYDDRDELIAVGYPDCDALTLFCNATGSQPK